MKIICIASNYPKKDSVSANSNNKNISLFLKPETALGKEGWPFFVPDFSNDIVYETELVVKISRLGKCIPARFAHRYYNEVTLGIDFGARDIQKTLIAEGRSWEISKGFDGSAVCGKFISLEDLGVSTEEHPTDLSIQNLNFEMQLNGETRQIGHTADMLHTVDEIVSYASQFFMLKMGDLIFTGTPAGKGNVKEGDIITAQLEGRDVLKCKIK